MADPKEDEVIYLPEVVVTPEDKLPPEGPVYSAGGGLTTPVREQLERTTPSSYAEFQVAEATPPDTFKFVPKDKRARPPSEDPTKPEEPSDAPKEAAPEPPSTFKFLTPDKRTPLPAKEEVPQGIGWNVAAGLGESIVPGVASALGSPVDIPVALGDALYGSLRSIYGDISAVASGEAPWTNAAERYKQQQETNPIPQAPAAKWLGKKIGELAPWLPSPENPFTSIVPQTEGERIARRAAQVGGQVAATTLGSKAFGMVRPPPPAATTMVTAADRAKGAANLALAAPTTLASAPPISTGLVAGGASAAGQYAAERAKEAGASDEDAARIERLTSLGAALPLGVAGAGANRLGAATGVNQLARKFSVIPMQELGASGTFGPFTKQRSQEALAGRALAGSPLNQLAQRGDWEQSGRNVRDTFGAMETDMKAATEAGRVARQAEVTDRLNTMGGGIADLTTRRDRQQTSLSGDLSYWNIAPEAAGKTIRSGLAGGIVKKEGPLAGLLNKDSKGKPLIADSALPDKIFDASFTPENFTSMFHQAQGRFREAYQSTVLSKFFKEAGIKDADGNPIGLDLTKAEKWQNTNRDALEASERKMRDVWGEDQRLKYSVKDRIDAAVAKQQAINDLNLHRDALLRGFAPGGRDAAIVGSIWQPGSAGAASLRDYLRMSGGEPNALANVVDIASANLRKNTMKPDGSGLDTTKATNWLSSHRDSLDQLPPAERAKFDDPVTAQATVDAYTAARARTLDAFKNGAAKGMLEGTPVDEAIRNIFADRTRSPEVAFRELSQRLRPDPAAHDALSSAFIQHGVEDALARTRAEMAAGAPTDRLDKIISAVRGNHPTNPNENSIKFMDHFNSYLRTNKKSVEELFGVPATTEMMKITGHTGYKKPAHPIGRALTTALLAGETFGYGLLAKAWGKQPFLTGSAATLLAMNTALQRVKAAGITNVNEFIPKVMSNPQLVRDLARGVEDKAAWTRVMQQLAIIGTEEDIGRYGAGAPSPEEVRGRVNIPRFRTEPGYRQGVESQLRIPHRPIPPSSRRVSPPLAR